MLRSLLRYDFEEGFDPFILYQISLENFNNIRRRLSKEEFISYETLDNMLYYEYEMTLDSVNQEIEEKNMKQMKDNENLVPILNISKDKPILPK